MSNTIYVVVEHVQGQLTEPTFEMLGAARELAEALGGETVAVLLGHEADSLADGLGTADRVVYVDDPALAAFNPEAYRRVLAALVEERAPAVTLIANTSMGMDLAAGLSVDVDLPLVAYCTGLAVEDGHVVATSRLYGGKAMAESVIDGERCIASVLAGAFPAEAGRAEGTPELEVVPAPDLSGLRTRFAQLIEPPAGDVDITQQDVLVSVGRGIGNADDIELAEELAELLSGAVSCSRPVVDNGWLPKTRQVGKSGATVKPRLYLALGISGAPEHVEGMKDAGLIVAINTDETAPIFDLATYGVVADLFDVVPALIEALE